MPTVRLLYFASIQEAVGSGQESWSGSAQTVGELRAQLVARGGDWASALGPQRAVRCARNLVLCDESAALAEGDEIAFFPPVTGG
jgi:molybdopterin synthase sulfur carrier subunit